MLIYIYIINIYIMPKTEAGIFTNNNHLIYPGAWLINARYGAHPIFFSEANAHTHESGGMADKADVLIVMPGFRVKCWQNANYGSTQLIDGNNLSTNNVNASVQPMYYNILDNAISSFKIWSIETGTGANDFIVYGY
jgi:hypothetical protein